MVSKIAPRCRYCNAKLQDITVEEHSEGCRMVLRFVQKCSNKKCRQWNDYQLIADDGEKGENTGAKISGLNRLQYALQAV